MKGIIAEIRPACQETEEESESTSLLWEVAKKEVIFNLTWNPEEDEQVWSYERIWLIQGVLKHTV